MTTGTKHYPTRDFSNIQSTTGLAISAPSKLQDRIFFQPSRTIPKQRNNQKQFIYRNYSNHKKRVTPMSLHYQSPKSFQKLIQPEISM